MTTASGEDVGVMGGTNESPTIGKRGIGCPAPS